MSRQSVDERLFDEISSFTRRLRSVFGVYASATGLTLTRARALFALTRRGSLSQKDLAQELEIETPTLVRLLDGMEKQGFIERQSVEGDRRAKQIAMTPHGAKVAEEVLDLARSLRADVLKSIPTGDMSTTVKVFATMSENISKSCRESVDA